MSEVFFEAGRFIFMIGIAALVAWVGWSRQLLGHWAWRFSLAGFLLLIFGAGIDVIDDYEFTRSVFTWHDSPWNTFLEKGVGYFGGFAMVFLAAWQWLPHIDAMHEKGHRAEEARRTAEEHRDILRDRLVQAQKMEAIGQLTGGIAHDFNNLLMVIDGYTRRAVNNIGNRDKVEESLKLVISASEQASSLTSQLLKFSQRQAIDKKIVRVEDLIAGVKGLLGQTVGKGIDVLFAIENPEARIETDANEFCQTLLNLAINARDAMPDGGTLTIGARDVDPGEGGNALAEIFVTDTGHSMDSATAARIFEPFFTTKEHGKGTGLGLATAYGFVQASGGQIDVESAPGAGTTIRLRFPLSARPATRAAHQAGGMARGNGETVLVVEDNGPLLRLMQDSLTVLGYNVLAASGGFEALEIDERTKTGIDVLLSDIAMPGLSGIEVAQVIGRRRPGIKIIFMSGYTDTSEKTGNMPPGATLLQKPVQVERLAEVLRSELNRPRLSKAG